MKLSNRMGETIEVWHGPRAVIIDVTVQPAADEQGVQRATMHMGPEAAVHFAKRVMMEAVEAVHDE